MNRLGPGLTAPADTDRIKDITLGRTSTEEDEDAKLLDRMRKRCITIAGISPLAMTNRPAINRTIMIPKGTDPPMAAATS